LALAPLLVEALVEQYVTASKAVEAVLREYNEQVAHVGGARQAAALAAVPQAMRTLFNQIEAFLKTAPGQPVNLKELLDARIEAEKKKAAAHKPKASLLRSKKGKEKAIDEKAIDFYGDSDLDGGVSYAPSQIVVCPGPKDAIFKTCLALINPSMTRNRCAYALLGYNLARH
jgi:hypothetical protein